jgi:hypothetical protein|tara:strand:+ start:809 stop:1021 length:213 start_codon:yes stop_codon:yes gene_type:complete
LSVVVEHQQKRKRVCLHLKMVQILSLVLHHLMFLQLVVVVVVIAEPTVPVLEDLVAVVDQALDQDLKEIQ